MIDGQKNAERFPRRVFLMGITGAAVAGWVHPQASVASEGGKVRIGVVGGGFGTAFCWHEHPNCEVAAVSDLRADRRDRLVARFKCDTVYESLEKLILDKTLDAVAVFTPAPDHVRHCTAVMNTGKHVISAVPAAMTLEDCQSLIDTVKKTGMTYMMAETSYYRQESITARQWFKEGRFGNLFYTEAEYHHHTEPDNELNWYNGEKTWRYGYPPMLYPTHSLAFHVGVTGERLTEVMCLGQSRMNTGEYRDNVYKNAFCNAMALYKTSGGNAVRQTEFRYVAAEICERAQWYGDEMSFFMPTATGFPGVVCRRGQKPEPFEQPLHWQTDMLPEPLRHDSGHGGSHTFLTHEFISALVENRRPAVDVYEAVAYTAPGIVAHESCLKNGELLQIPDFGRSA